MEEMVLKALAFASEKHRDTYRKGNKAPYIVHPLEVMTILMTEKYPTSVLVAGLLHDTLEDTDTTKEELLQHFGEEVLRLVTYNSEDKSRSWIERKHHTIEQMNNEWDDLASALCFADKLANLRSLFRAIEANGLGIFNKMNAPKEHVLSYYYNIFLAGRRLIGREMYHEYEVLLNLVHQAVQDDRNEIDKAIIDAYGEQVSRWINQKPIDYKRLFPVAKYLADRYREHEMECMVGTMLFEGKGTDLDVASAIDYYESAAEHGNMDAPLYLGNLYASGMYVKRDWKYAMDLYELAKERGCDLADDAFEKLQMCIDLGIDSYKVGSEELIIKMIDDENEEDE